MQNARIDIADLAAAAAAAYEPVDQCALWAWQRGLPRFRGYAQNGAAGFVAANDADMVIAFRGTDIAQLCDVLADFRIWPSRGALGWHHLGFLTYLHSLWHRMVWDMAAFARDGQRVHVVGHSMGGAMAVSAVAHLLEAGKPPACLATFGAPRCVTAGVGRAIVAAVPDVLRIVNNNCIGARVPLGLLFRHFGRLHYFDRRGRLHVAPSRWLVAWDRICGRRESLRELRLDGLGDHSMSRYRELTEAAFPLGGAGDVDGE